MIRLIKKVWGKVITPVNNDEPMFVACFSLVIIGLIIYIFTIQPGQFSLRDNSLFKETQTFSPTTTQSPSPAVKAAKTVAITASTINPDPIITCNIHADCGGGSKQMRRSECNQTTCCQVHNELYLYLSDSECKIAQDNYRTTNSSSSSPNTNSYNYPVVTPLPTYPPCTIYYPALGYSKTYDYTSPEQCQQWKDKVTPTTTQVINTPTPYVTPTMSPEEVQALVDQINKAISDCKNDVNSTYNQKVLNCEIQYGGTSAAEACTRATNKERDKKLKECES